MSRDVMGDVRQSLGVHESLFLYEDSLIFNIISLFSRLGKFR
jgi:hypothetical protein